MKSIYACIFWGISFLSSSVAAEDAIYTGFLSNKAAGGYDVVAYFKEAKPVEGQKAYKHRWKGADWYFSSEENLASFKQTPEKFAPQYGGYCAWAVSEHNDFAPGNPKYWKIVNDKLYLNYDKKVQQDWEKSQNDHIVKADQNWSGLEKKIK